MTEIINHMEIAARALLNTGSRQTNSEVVALGVFRAMWSAALSQEKVEAVGCAMYGFSSLSLGKALDSLVKAKILRTRRHAKVRHYEVNFPESAASARPAEIAPLSLSESEYSNLITACATSSMRTGSPEWQGGLDAISEKLRAARDRLAS